MMTKHYSKELSYAWVNDKTKECFEGCFGLSPEAVELKLQSHGWKLAKTSEISKEVGTGLYAVQPKSLHPFEGLYKYPCNRCYYCSNDKACRHAKKACIMRVKRLSKNSEEYN